MAPAPPQVRLQGIFLIFLVLYIFLSLLLTIYTIICMRLVSRQFPYPVLSSYHQIFFLAADYDSLLVIRCLRSNNKPLRHLPQSSSRTWGPLCSTGRSHAETGVMPRLGLKTGD